MKVWTIQVEEFVNNLYHNGIIHGNAKKVEPYFNEAYSWMIRKMIDKLGYPNSLYYPNCYLIWVWKDRPDLRYSGQLPRNTCGYLLELEIEDHKILLSDFESWHCVLNHWYCAYSEFDEDYYNKKVEHKAPTRYNTMVMSWDRIFDINTPTLYGSGTIIQGTVWQITTDMVKSITAFRAA